MTTIEWIRALNDIQLGRFGEAICQQLFACSGVLVTPLHAIAGHGAPMARSSSSGIVLTDFDCHFAPGFSLAIDAKCKRRAVMYRNAGNELRHGIDERNYLEYKKYGLLTGREAGLCIVELFDCDGATWSGSVMVGAFNVLGTPFFSHGNDNAKKVYWPRSRFTQLGKWQPELLVRIAQKYERPDVSRELRKAFSSASYPNVPTSTGIYAKSSGQMKMF